MSIRSKLIFSFTIIVILSLLITGVNMAIGQQFGRAIDRAFEDSVPDLQYLWQMESLNNAMMADINNTLWLTTQADLALSPTAIDQVLAYETALDEKKQAFNAILTDYDAVKDDDDIEQDYVAVLREQNDALYNTGKQLISLALLDPQDPEIAVLRQELMTYQTAILAQIDLALTDEKAEIDEGAAFIIQSSAMAAGVGVTLVILSIILSILFAWLLDRQISQGLVQLNNAVTEIGAGNLDTRLNWQRDDEIGTLAGGINRMTDSLSRTMISKNELEALIVIRTAELSEANTDLLQEIKEREAVEAAFQHAQTRLQARIKEMSLLNKISLAAAQTHTLNDTLDAVLQEVQAAFEAEFGAVILMNVGDQPYIIWNSQISTTLDMNFGQPDSAGSPWDLILRPLYETRGSMLIANLYDNPLGAPMRPILTQAKLNHIQSLLIIPFFRRDKFLGVTGLGFTTQTFSLPQEKFNFADSIGRQVSAIIENAILLHQTAEARDAAEKASQAKDTFLANMSHELRTPLNSIMGYAQWLQLDTTLPKKHHHAANTIHSSGEHLLALLNDILDISKIESGVVALNSVNFNLVRFLHSLADMIEIRTQQQGLIFDFNICPDLPVFVNGDERFLRQVLINLLGNAIKFTPEGSVSFTIDRLTDDRIRFEIGDTGVGIAAKDTDRIFQLFERVGENPDATEGTGLGLAISRQLVTMMGGDLQVESTLGEGSKFWFDLPLPAIIHKTPAQQSTPRQIIGYSGPRRKILIVDDKQENRDVLVKILAGLDFEIYEAVNGLDAIDQATTLAPALIFMDLVMPVMDGYQATQKIRDLDLTPTPVIIALTASAFGEAKTRSLAVGCDAHFSKPFHIDELLSLMQTHLKLNWVYQQDPPADNPATPQTPPAVTNTPDVETLRALYQFALKGKVVDLRTELQALADKQPSLTPFVNHLQALAERFAMREIKTSLKQQLTTAEKIGKTGREESTPQ